MKPLDQSYSKSRRFKNQVKAVVTNPYNVIVLVAIVLLTYLIVLPLVDMLSTTFQLAQRDLRATGGTMADVGKFTLYYWQRLLASDLSWNLLFKPLLNSLTIGVGVSVCAIALGSILAWLMVRSDLPFKPFFSLAVIIPYMIPSWVKSQAWLSMFKTPRVGGAPGFIAALMMNAGISTDRIEAILSPIAYGRLAIIIVLTLHYYAYTYLLVSAALNSINSELEEMGEIQGASKPLILRKITLPLVLPAMLSAVILTFSKAIGTFGTINYLGSPVSFRTLSSELYSNSKSQNTQTAFAMAILMICIASLSVFINQRLIGARKSYATIGGKGGRSTPIGLGGWKPIVTIILFIFFLVGIIMPVIILILESCMLKEGTYSLPIHSNSEVLYYNVDFFEKNAPFGAEVHVEPLEAGMGWAMNPDCEATQDALTSLKEAFGIDPVNKGEGGSIPFIPELQKIFPDAQVVVTGPEDPISNAHSPNESVSVSGLRKDVVAEALLLDKLGRA